MHVDRLFDVGLYLIEELARRPPFSEPWGGGGEDEWGTVGHWLAFGCHCELVDSSRSEQLETMLLAIALIITATFWLFTASN